MNALYNKWYQFIVEWHSKGNSYKSRFPKYQTTKYLDEILPKPEKGYFK